MAININADTTTGLELTSDTSGNINIQNDGTTVVAVTSSGAAVTGTLSANGANISTQPTFRNRIINGDMRIDQRNAGASVTPTAIATWNYTLDRWAALISVASKFSVQQNAASVTPPAGFTNYLGVTSLSSYSVASGDYFWLEQPIEGYNISDLAYGTANAKTITLSFWVRSSLTGTFGGSLANVNNDYAYPFSYTISSANTWEQKTITIAGPNAGTWNTTNSQGIRVRFGLGVGSNNSGTAGSWANVNYVSATGATSVVGTNGATFYITGVQLEVGDAASDFEFMPYDMELARCQRYYIKYGGLIYSQMAMGIAQSTTRAYYNVPLSVQMRATPSIGFSTLQTHDSTTAYSITGLGPAGNETNNFNAYIYGDVASGLTAYRPYMLRAGGSASGYLEMIAEL